LQGSVEALMSTVALALSTFSMNLDGSSPGSSVSGATVASH